MKRRGKEEYRERQEGRQRRRKRRVEVSSGVRPELVHIGELALDQGT